MFVVYVSTYWCPIFCSIKCLYVLSCVLRCPLRFPNKNDVGSSLPPAGIISNMLGMPIVVSNTHSVCVLCAQYCQFIKMIHSWLSLPFSLTFISCFLYYKPIERVPLSVSCGCGRSLSGLIPGNRYPYRVQCTCSRRKASKFVIFQ